LSDACPQRAAAFCYPAHEGRHLTTLNRNGTSGAHYDFSLFGAQADSGGLLKWLSIQGAGMTAFPSSFSDQRSTIYRPIYRPMTILTLAFHDVKFGIICL
jgi:hypothetical protein